jgi:hypothetical protein
MEHAEPGSEAPSIEEIAARLRDDLHLLREAAQRRRDELVGWARRAVDEHPFAAVGLGVAAGYVLAGGLFSRVTLRLVGIGARMYFARLVQGAVGPGLDVLVPRSGDGAQPPRH